MHSLLATAISFLDYLVNHWFHGAVEELVVLGRVIPMAYGVQSSIAVWPVASFVMIGDNKLITAFSYPSQRKKKRWDAFTT